MTMPAAEALEAEKDKLWLTDAELIRRLGVPERDARVALRELDSKPSGFPKKSKLWGNRRYWPAVNDYFDQVYGLKVPPSQQGRTK